MMRNCPSSNEREGNIRAMTHEERMKYANHRQAMGSGLVVSGIGCFAGLAGGLWGSMGGSSIAVGIGAASGLWAASCGPFSEATLARRIDGELSNGNADPGTFEGP
ncbi:hypothetical protein THAOC_06175 [Thalassiosira oceanica]|uniref:Uncharacterized protein n=1 Tax=Thalassiosira oceanica TaxID=159749 RepID=K0T5B0_THAOC|nr:hypothetical protein THAOC_06175 [Thalassiosira oceanica]|eukprot:EJK72299.1 hypothetical protein THAOC_06175 [Thalassiosira oceanica]